MFTTRYGIPSAAEDLLLDAEDALVLGGRLLRRHEAEHLDLVELVDAEQPARVAPRGARLAPEAGREPGVAHRQVRGVEDLLRVQRGQRDLARPDEVQVVGGHVVDLLLGVGQHAGAEERLLADEHGRDDGLEPVAPDDSSAQRTSASSSRTSSPRRYANREPDRRAPRSMSIRSPASSRWSRGSGTGSTASPTSRTTVSSSARGGVGEVRERAQELLQPLVRGRGLRRQILDLRREALEVLELRRRRRAPRACRRRPPRTPPSARSAAPRPRDRRAALAVERQDVVDRVGHAGTAACERCLHAVRILADAPEVQHGS